MGLAVHLASRAMSRLPQYAHDLKEANVPASWSVQGKRVRTLARTNLGTSWNTSFTCGTGPVWVMVTHSETDLISSNQVLAGSEKNPKILGLGLALGW
jgi:hypothetical protein